MQYTFQKLGILFMSFYMLVKFDLAHIFQGCFTDTDAMASLELGNCVYSALIPVMSNISFISFHTLDYNDIYFILHNNIRKCQNYHKFLGAHPYI